MLKGSTDNPPKMRIYCFGLNFVAPCYFVQEKKSIPTSSSIDRCFSSNGSANFKWLKWGYDIETVKFCWFGMGVQIDGITRTSKLNDLCNVFSSLQLHLILWKRRVICKGFYEEFFFTYLFQIWFLSYMFILITSLTTWIKQNSNFLKMALSSIGKFCTGCSVCNKTLLLSVLKLAAVIGTIVSEFSVGKSVTLRHFSYHYFHQLLFHCFQIFVSIN